MAGNEQFLEPVSLAKAAIGRELDPATPGPLTPAEELIIRNLHTQARDFGFIDERYWIETAQALVLPANRPVRKVSIGDIRHIKFGGVLAEFNKLSLYRRLGIWCLRFEEPVIAPDLNRIADTHELHVPVLAVTKIEPL